MNAKPFATMLAIAFVLSGPSNHADSVSKENGEWQTHVFAKIGLKIKLPPWNADVEDQDKMWTLLVYLAPHDPAIKAAHQGIFNRYGITPEQTSIEIKPKE